MPNPLPPSITPHPPTIGIIGGGVSGLTTAIVLCEAGHDVTIWRRDPIAQSTSSVAAAVWHPFQAFPADKVLHWSGVTYARLVALAADPTTGVVLQRGREFFRQPTPDPPWAGIGWFQHLAPAELPLDFVAGYAFEAPVAETPRYLRYLIERLARLGGRIVDREIASLDEALAETPVVINCAGLGGGPLAGDDSIYPIRGQIVRLAPLPGATFRFDEHGPGPITYIIPRGDGVICGGSVQPGVWDTAVDMPTAHAIHARALVLMPELAGLPILEHKVGLRPGRPAVRVEREARADGVVIHNYGHGGSGYTVSWGCAEDVLSMLINA